MTTKKVKKFLAGGIAGAATYTPDTQATPAAAAAPATTAAPVTPEKLSLAQLRGTMSDIHKQRSDLHRQYLAGDIDRKQLHQSMRNINNQYADRIDAFRERRDAGLASQSEDFRNQFNAMRSEEKNMRALRDARFMLRNARETGNNAAVRAIMAEHPHLRQEILAQRAELAPYRSGLAAQTGVFKKGGSVKTKPAAKPATPRGMGIAKRGGGKGTMR